MPGRLQYFWVLQCASPLPFNSTNITSSYASCVPQVLELRLVQACMLLRDDNEIGTYNKTFLSCKWDLLQDSHVTSSCYSGAWLQQTPTGRSI